MCKSFFEFDTYMILLDKLYKGEDLSQDDLNYLKDEKHIKQVFKEVNRYSRDVLFKTQPYDIENGGYYYIVYYKENCYKVFNDELNSTYKITLVEDLKHELKKLNTTDDEYVLNDIICVEKIFEHNKRGMSTIVHIVRKRK